MIQSIPDISFYQYRYKDATLREFTQDVDFVKMRTQSPAVIIRAGQNLWPDIAFNKSWRGAKEAGLLRGSYFFYDSRADPKQQAEKWAEVLGDDIGEFGAWMDFEDKYGGQYHEMRYWYDFAERMKALIPNIKLGVYTGFYYWAENSIPSVLPYFKQYPLWIAAYGTDTPRVPLPWTDFLLHQYTDNGNGAQYGAASGNIDLNRYKGELPVVKNTSTLTAYFDGKPIVYKEQ